MSRVQCLHCAKRQNEWETALGHVRLRNDRDYPADVRLICSPSHRKPPDRCCCNGVDRQLNLPNDIPRTTVGVSCIKPALAAPYLLQFWSPRRPRCEVEAPTVVSSSFSSFFRFLLVFLGVCLTCNLTAQTLHENPLKSSRYPSPGL